MEVGAWDADGELMTTRSWSLGGCLRMTLAPKERALAKAGFLAWKYYISFMIETSSINSRYVTAFPFC